MILSSTVPFVLIIAMFIQGDRQDTVVQSNLLATADWRHK
jgi:hypothetical protein